jgi:hypothetical protein
LLALLLALLSLLLSHSLGVWLLPSAFFLYVHEQFAEWV